MTEVSPGGRGGGEGGGGGAAGCGYLRQPLLGQGHQGGVVPAMAVADAGGVGLGDVGEVGVRGAAVLGVWRSVGINVLVEDVEALGRLSGLSLNYGGPK